MLRRQSEARRRHAAVRAEMKLLQVKRFRLPVLRIAGSLLLLANVIAAIATLARISF